MYKKDDVRFSRMLITVMIKIHDNDNSGDAMMAESSNGQLFLKPRRMDKLTRKLRSMVHGCFQIP